MAVALSELRKKKHLSVSAVSTFLSCPRKYNLAYIERAPKDYYPASLVLGSAWHSAVARWLDGIAEDDALDEQLREDLRERLRRDDVPVIFDTPDENADTFIERAVKMFAKFREDVPRPRKVLGTEIAFETELVHPTTGEVLPVPVIGALDAVVIEQDGAGPLWELKTGRKWAPDRIEHDAQVTLYRKAARELGFDGVRLRVLVATKTKEPQVQALDIERSEPTRPSWRSCSSTSTGRSTRACPSGNAGGRAARASTRALAGDEEGLIPRTVAPSQAPLS